MAAPIDGLGSLQRSEFPIERPSTGVRGSDGVDFADALAGAISDASSAEKTAESQAVRFADGDPAVGIHEVVIASEQASIATRFATTLKNRLIEAYKEIMSTQV